MSDPLSRLGSLGSSGGSPDLDAIKLRAHRIRRRRQTGLAGAGAAAMAIIAVVGVLLATGPEGNKATTTLAESLDAGTPSPDAAAQRYAKAPAPANRSDAADDATTGSTTSGGGAAEADAAPTPLARTDGSEESSALAAAPAQDARTAKDLVATLEVGNRAIGRGKTFTLKVCNPTSGTVTREFGTSQRYDVEVFDADGAVVWRWSDGMFFSQVVGSESWKAKECKQWIANWDGSRSDGGRAPAGDYSAVGIVKSQPEVRSTAKPFSLAAL